MSTDPKTLLKYANLQMAAEAFLSPKTAPVRAEMRGPIDIKLLTDGNEHVKKGQTPFRCRSRYINMQFRSL